MDLQKGGAATGGGAKPAAGAKPTK
jgi:hypothetical protein